MLAIAKISNPFAHSTNRFMFPCETTEQEQYVCLDYIILVFLKFYLSPKAQSPPLVDFFSCSASELRASTNRLKGYASNM